MWIADDRSVHLMATPFEPEELFGADVLERLDAASKADLGLILQRLIEANSDLGYEVMIAVEQSEPDPSIESQYVDMDYIPEVPIQGIRDDEDLASFILNSITPDPRWRLDHLSSIVSALITLVSNRRKWWRRWKS